MDTWYRRRALALALTAALGVGACAVPAALVRAESEGGAAVGAPADTSDAETAAGTAADTPDADTAAGTAADTPDADTAAGTAADTPDAETAAEALPQPDAEGTLSFANIGARMRESYYPMYILQESIDDIEGHDYEWRKENLRIRLNEIGDMSWLLTMMGGSASALQSSYDATLRSINDITYGTTARDDAEAMRQYRNAQDQLVTVGESLFMSIKDLEAQDAALTRTLRGLDRTLKELRLREELGQVSALTVDQAANGRVQAESGQSTLRTGIEVALLNLKSMTGAPLDGPLALGELPKVTEEQLAAMDLEKDLAAAKERSYAIFDAGLQIRDFQAGTYIDVILQFGDNDKVFEVSQVKHALRSLEFQRDNTIVTFELNFRTLFAQVKDQAQALEAKRAALASQEKSYAASELKYRQGSLAENKLADAADELAQAKEDVAGAERALFSKYRAYQWAVDYGIINSSQGGSTNAG